MLGLLETSLPRCAYCHNRPGVVSNQDRWWLCDTCVQWAPIPAPQTLSNDIRPALDQLRALIGALSRGE